MYRCEFIEDRLKVYNCEFSTYEQVKNFVLVVGEECNIYSSTGELIEEYRYDN